MEKLFQFLGFATLVIIILNLLNIRENVYTATFNIINYPLEIGSINISLGDFLAFCVTILFTLWLSSFIRYILEKETFPRVKLKAGMPGTILLMIKFTFVLLGIVFAFAAAGIQMDKLAILMGALGVGIGFGLQNIINNFVSGIILAIERPMTIGDIIDIPGADGYVRDIGLRASTVRTWDGSDVVVPNAEFISNKLTNWTLFDKHRRVIIEVRVPFDSDMEAVSKLLLETENEIPEVMKKPHPYLNFKGIGSSAMEMNLYCWINDTDKVFSYSTIIRKIIYKALQDAGYETPLPKQDLKINSKIEAEDENI
jgi:small-conductance mechanosensitive channel